MPEDDDLDISFGALESPVDYRTLTEDMVGDMAALPPERGSIPLDEDFMNDLCNQRKLGICTAAGTRMAVEYHFRDKTRLSEYWLYLMGKVLVDQNLSEGSSAFTMLKTANKYGVPTKAMEEKYPLKVNGTYAQFISDFHEKYGVSGALSSIPSEILNNAASHKIPGYYSVAVDPVAFARTMDQDRLVVFRIRVGESMYTDEQGRRTRKPEDLFPLRAPKKVESGHIMSMNGWDGLEPTQELQGPNSWSRTWGRDGYFELVYKTHAGEFLTEAWAITPRVPEIITHVKQLPAAKDFHYDFPRRIERGMQNEDVKQLHIALSILGYLDIKLDEWGTYGPKTSAGVLAFQKAEHLLPIATLDKNHGNYVHDLTLNALRARFKKK